MSGMPSHLRIALDSIKCFANDGTLDLGELNYLLGLATADGVVDDDEKRVLGNIFQQVKKSDVSEIVWERIQSIKDAYQI